MTRRDPLARLLRRRDGSPTWLAWAWIAREGMGTVTTDAGTILVWDMKAKRVTLDGRDIAPAECIGYDFDVETNYGYLGAVTLTIFARNILIRSELGETTSPTASDEGRRIVREGLSDVLAWLGETP